MSGVPSCVVMWALPTGTLTATTVFSFLGAAQEEALSRAANDVELVTMARLMDEVGDEARACYVEMIADAGLFRLRDGRTLRAAMHRKGKTSQWWYHPVTFRNSENEPTYTHLLMILAVVREAARRGIRHLHLVRPPPEVADVLASRFSITIDQPLRRLGALDLLRGLLGRGRIVLATLTAKLALMRQRRRFLEPMDVALQGYWDWSVYPDAANPGLLRDRYFGALPDRLRARGMRVGYWCWYDPDNRPGGSGRCHGEILEPLVNRRDVLMLPALLTLREIFAAGCDFSALPILWSVVRQPTFQEVFRRDGLDFFPLFSAPLARGGLSSGIPQCLMYEAAAARAQALTAPRVVVRFQEHNPPSRAVYAAMSGTTTSCWAMQHASYNHSKTYLALHPTKEFAGAGDEEPVPHPRRVCVMGELGRRLFAGCGYLPKQLLVTGSARYDHVRLDVARRAAGGRPGGRQRPLHVLIASSLPARADIQLVLAAVSAARELDSQVVLRLRQHPFDRMEVQPGWADVAAQLEMSKASLDADLAWADLVLISQSTVGEEAFLAGKPVWQFRFPYPDQSALAQVAAIPRFYAIHDLRQALDALLATDECFAPTPDEVADVHRMLFQTEDHEPSTAIADALCAEYAH